MNLTAEEIRILIDWYVFTSIYMTMTNDETNLLEKLRAELRRIDG